jgi:hypothetical protein
MILAISAGVAAVGNKVGVGKEVALEVRAAALPSSTSESSQEVARARLVAEVALGQRLRDLFGGEPFGNRHPDGDLLAAGHDLRKTFRAVVRCGPKGTRRPSSPLSPRRRANSIVTFARNG